MLRRAFRLAFLTTVVSLTAGVAIAQACYLPDLHLGTSSAGPGDPVSFSVSGVEPPAKWTVTPSSGGQVSGQGPSGGSFEMPDLGAEPQTVTVRGFVHHEGPGEGHTEGPGDYPLPKSGALTVQYVPPPAAPGDPPPQSPAQVPEAPEQTAQPPASQQPETSNPGGGQQHAGNGPGDGARGEPGSPSDPTPSAGASAPTAARSSQTLTRPGSLARANESGAQASESVASPAQAEAASAGRAESAGGTESAGRAESAGGDGVGDLVTNETAVGPVEVPTIGLAVVGLILLLGTAGLATVFFIAGRLAPRPDRIAVEVGEALDPDTIEAELQRIIVEETRRPVASG